MDIDTMTGVVTLDFETKSEADLKQVGAWAYSEHPTTDVICLCYAIDDEEVKEWWPGKNGSDAMPFSLADALAKGYHFEAHNVSFEISIWLNVMVKRYAWKFPPLVQWRDSMAVACYFAMPAALDRLARVLGLEGKDPEGARLITKYSKLHLKTAKAAIPPEDFRKFVNYCRGDVEQERQIGNILGVLPDPEVEIFLRDLETNLRGLFLDQDGIDNATVIVDEREAKLKQEFFDLVGCNPGQTARVKEWFMWQGIDLENLQAEYLGDLLESDELGQGDPRRALEIRLAINKASTKKLDAMSRQRGADGRARWQTRYHGAATGRNTGSGFQPLNLNRGFEKMDPDQLVRDISYRSAGWLDAVYGDAMDAVSKASRYWIKAAPGHRILAGDFVSVEAVLLACGAKEEWKIEAFRRKDPLYAVMAAKIHKLDPTLPFTLGDKGFKAKYPAERQDGKTGELAFGYQGALGAWLKFDSSGRHSDERILEINKTWRGEHPETTTYWREMEQAALDALAYPGREIVVDRCGASFQTIDCWLSMRLHNGKRLWYFDPQLRQAMPPWHQPSIVTKKDGSPNPCHTGECDCTPRTQVTYMAQKEGQWRRVSSYGGKWVENWTQAISREVLECAKKRVVAAGYPLILTVYDEVVAEPPIGFGSKEEFEELMLVREDWFADWPIGVDVFEGPRYKK